MDFLHVITKLVQRSARGGQKSETLHTLASTLNGQRSSVRDSISGKTIIFSSFDGCTLVDVKWVCNSLNYYYWPYA
jgi:hypothetical protein